MKLLAAVPGAPATVACKQRTAGAASPRPGRSTERTQLHQTEAAEDRVLVARFNQGDEGAFAEIVARYGQRTHALADRFLRNRADAEEVAQDTFIRAHRGLATFRGDSSLATWLHRITVNLARNRYWYFFRRKTHLTLSLDFPIGAETKGTFADFISSDEPDPARLVAADEFVQLVATCMQQLDAGHREILILRNQLNYPYDRIARALGINEGTVKSRIARARSNLRGLMARTCPEVAEASGLGEWLGPQRSARTFRHSVS